MMLKFISTAVLTGAMLFTPACGVLTSAAHTVVSTIHDIGQGLSEADQTIQAVCAVDDPNIQPACQVAVNVQATVNQLYQTALVMEHAGSDASEHANLAQDELNKLWSVLQPLLFKEAKPGETPRQVRDRLKRERAARVTEVQVHG